MLLSKGFEMKGITNVLSDQVAINPLISKTIFSDIPFTATELTILE
ncbi:hypothetical protein [Telluribacter sp. SYSU D00476]|nr:hypothetical protein [Telluribacter sp. SYSU D00476]